MTFAGQLRLAVAAVCLSGLVRPSSAQPQTSAEWLIARETAEKIMREVLPGQAQCQRTAVSECEYQVNFNASVYHIRATAAANAIQVTAGSHRLSDSGPSLDANEKRQFLDMAVKIIAKAAFPGHDSAVSTDCVEKVLKTAQAGSGVLESATVTLSDNKYAVECTGSATKGFLGDQKDQVTGFEVMLTLTKKEPDNRF